MIKEKIHYMDIGPFWEQNKELIERIMTLDYPYRSKLIYNEFGSGYLDDVNQFYIYYSIFRLEKKKIMCTYIEAYFDKNSLQIEREVIRNFQNLYDGTQYNLNKTEIKSESHKKWLKKILKSHKTL